MRLAKQLASDLTEPNVAVNMLPFLSIVTGSGLQIPRIDPAPVIRTLCENYWKEAG
jgi:hypothetical protein